MKVRVKQAFNDWQTNVRRHENEVFEMTDERFNELSHNFKSEFSACSSVKSRTAARKLRRFVKPFVNSFIITPLYV